MSKVRQSNKEAKKPSTMTLKEKRAAKQTKKNAKEVIQPPIVPR